MRLGRRRRRWTSFIRLSMASCVAVFSANAAAMARQPFAVETSVGTVRIESFGNCARATCPAVLVLSGSKGFRAPAYDEIGATLKAAGLSAYLVHALTPADLAAIGNAAGCRRAPAGSRLPYRASRANGAGAVKYLPVTRCELRG